MVEFDVAGVRTVAPTAALYNPCIYGPGPACPDGWDDMF